MKESYLGAKGGSGVHQVINNLMPPHDTYGEMFLGTGVIMKTKAPAQYNIGIDKSQKMLDKFDYPADELLCTDSIEWLANYKPKGRAVLYCDPPYVPSTRTSKARYEHELTDSDHERLISNIKVINPEKTFILLSGYKNDLYEELLGDWWSKDFQAMTRGGVRTETVWCNFQPSDVHYHTFAGENYTDRQRIQRKAKRWANNFKQMPKAEQQAVLAAMLTI
jgi:site-specific DNA-adenine methylase